MRVLRRRHLQQHGQRHAVHRLDDVHARQPCVGQRQPRRRPYVHGLSIRDVHFGEQLTELCAPRTMRCRHGADSPGQRNDSADVQREHLRSGNLLRRRHRTGSSVRVWHVGPRRQRGQPVHRVEQLLRGSIGHRCSRERDDRSIMQRVCGGKFQHDPERAELHDLGDLRVWILRYDSVFDREPRVHSVRQL